MSKKLSKEALEARRAYHREYYRRNKERIMEQRREFWERKVKEMADDEEGCAS